MRIVYMGTPEFAVPALEALIASEHDVVGVFTNPDRPSGRGKQLAQSAVKRAAVAAGIEVFQPERVRKNPEALEKLRAWEPDLAVVTAYGQILPRSILEVPRLGCINIHASLLPKYRGAAPINWCIIRGEEETGITTMQMDVGLDTGPMLMQAATAIGELETAGQLHDRLAPMGAELIMLTLYGLEQDTVFPVAQDDAESSYAPMMAKETGRIDWTQSARDVANLIRGVNPWPGAFSNQGNERIKFHLARATEGSGEPGQVLESDRQLLVACGSGAIEALELQAPGSRAMQALDFLNGYRIEAGARFG